MKPGLSLTVLGVVTAVFVATGCGDKYHPDGFAAGAMHGPAMKMQAEDCRVCHGEDLTGANGVVGCDGCHEGATPTAWRTNCTFCHGGVENDTGAPPRNIDGTDQVGPFPVHTIHVTGSALAPAFDCKECHSKALDALSPGHIFDSTPGVSENDYGNGLAPQTTFTLPDRTCANDYCHGNGRADNGTIQAQSGPLACDGCHAVQSGGATAWLAMSGGHPTHLAVSGVSCADCHQATTSDGVTITDRTKHVNGLRDVAIPTANFTYDVATHTCTGTCHGVAHAGFGWVAGGGGSPHPPGFAAPEMHGPEMELQRSDCRGCHGANLEGGTGPSCDSCHQAGWRTNCTYCHGGGLDQTGAPPQDLGSSNNNASQSFEAHPKHVAQIISKATDCTICHGARPTDVMTVNHAFDATPGVAENAFTGIAAGTTYNGTGTCANNYCHGNGRTNGSYQDGGAVATCASCHPGMNSSATWSLMSGKHRKHLNLGYTCGECHQTVANAAGTAIIAPLLHIDKLKQVSMRVSTITWNPTNRTCTGQCHEGHNSEGW